jgi:type I restriction enzyme S subunit
MSFPAYEQYKDSEYEWVGTAVPIHWQVRRLKSLVAESLKYGANESAENEYRTQPRFVRITDIDDDGGLREETFKSLSAEIAEPYLLQEGDVLLARSGATVGKSFIYSREWGTACFAGYLIRARLRASECLPTWLYYFCQTDGYWGYIVGSQIQATIQNVSAEKYANLYLPVPPLPEQRTIASFLDTETSKIDSLVSEQRRLIELLKEKRQAVISHAVTKGLNPDVKMKDSGIEWLGDVPEGWDVTKIKYECRYESGHTPSKSKEEYWVEDDCIIPWVSLNDTKTIDTSDYIDDTATKISDIGMANSSAHYIDAGAVVFTRDGARVGLSAITTRPMCVSQHIIAWVCGPRVSNVFLLHVIYAMNAEIYRITAGSTIPTIGMPDVKRMSMPLPPHDEQEEIVDYLINQREHFATLIAQAERAIELLQERRTALISAAVTGKIDVREFATAAVA